MLLFLQFHKMKGYYSLILVSKTTLRVSKKDILYSIIMVPKLIWIISKIQIHYLFLTYLLFI
jgi:hypothetical protein